MLTTLLLALVPLQSPTSSPLSAEIDGFSFKPGKQFAGTVYHYRKSNVDGSNPSHVDLYMASESRIESFKYHTGHPVGTLVCADMDWNTFSVARFQTSRLHADGTVEVTANLETRADVLHCEMGGGSFTVDIVAYPWHTYDFDLASLNMGLRYLSDPEGVTLVNMIDEYRGRLVPKGFVELAYLDDEQRAGHDCRHYSIDGPGLQDRGGELWVRKGTDPVIVDYEIDLPDESSMQSGKMVLTGTEKLDADAWKRHQKAALAE